MAAHFAFNVLGRLTLRKPGRNQGIDWEARDVWNVVIAALWELSCMRIEKGFGYL
jgi:hypothetical protein